VDAIPPVQAEDPNSGTNARNLFIPEADGKSVAKSVKDSDGESGFSGSGAPSASSTDLAAGNYTPVDTNTNTNPADTTNATIIGLPPERTTL
jgi:hypothetical protein